MIPQDDNNTNRSLELCRRVVTTESFIEEAKAIYGDIYDYSKVDYKNRKNPVVVGCAIHGDFKIHAREHLDGKGCPKCAKGEKFVQKLQAKFGNKFLLDNFIYHDSKEPVELICPIHGSFSRIPNSILNSVCGCPDCGNEYARSLNDKAHAEAEERKAEERKKKEEEYRHLCEISQYGSFVNHNGKKIFRGCYLTSQKGIECAIEETRNNNTINWEQARVYFHVWQDSFYISDEFIPGMFYGNDDERIYSTSVPLQDEMSAEDLVLAAEERFVELLNEGHRPRFFTKASYLMNRLEVGDEYSYDDFDSHAGYFYKYVEVLAKTDFLDIEENENTYKIIRIDKRGYSKPKRKTSSLRVADVDECTRRIIKQDLYNINLPDSFVCIDFETLYSQRVSACSVGMVKFKDGQIVDKYYSLIRPPFEYPGKCGVALTWIHGFTEEMLQNERTFEEILPEMETFVEGLPLVAHNACVERACIRDTSEFYEITTSLDYDNIIDTYPLSKRIEQMMGCEVVGSGTHSLDAVCRRFNVPEMQHHNALDDAEMCGNLLLAFKTVLSNADTIVQPTKKEVVVTSKIKPEDKIQRMDLENVEDNPFKGKVVVLTGFAKADSQQYAHQLNELGAIIKDSVNKKTNILITGYNAGPSKMKKAEEFGAQIIPENEFLEMLKSL